MVMVKSRSIPSTYRLSVNLPRMELIQMLNIFSFILEVSGFCGLVFGYTRKNRNLMLVAAIVMWMGGSINDIVRGFLAGMALGH
jgi:hypothetical protein